LKRIIVPLDGSRLSEESLPVAARLARATGAELLLLHVIEASHPEAVHGERHLAGASEARAYLEAVVAGLGEGLRARAHVHEEESRDPGRAIGDHVEELESDLVVLASHGKHRVGHFLSGSVAQRVLSTGRAPVLILPAGVPAGFLEPSSSPLLVVAVDGSGRHPPALDWLGAFARALGLEVELLLAVDTRGSLRGDSAAIARSLPGATSLALEAAVVESQAWLEGLAASADLAGLKVGTGLLRGGADKALARHMKGRMGGLVAIGTHGHAGLGALWEGSMAASMLSRLEGPVILMPA